MNIEGATAEQRFQIRKLELELELVVEANRKLELDRKHELDLKELDRKREKDELDKQHELDLKRMKDQHELAKMQHNNPCKSL